MTVSGTELKAPEPTVLRKGLVSGRDILLFVCKSPVVEVERVSWGVESGAGPTRLMYQGVNTRITAIKAKAKRVFRSIYL